MIIINLISIIVILLFILVVGLYSIFFKNKKGKFIKNGKNAILATKIKKGLIPYSISNKYKILNLSSHGFRIDNGVLNLLKLSIKYFLFEPYFILKSLVKISFYSYLCLKYNPAAIITTSEFSFTSSILTAYLKKKNISHINIMHGEKLFYIRDSFFRFSEFWVWNIHYINLFKKLYAYKNQFKIEIPPLYKKMEKNYIRPPKEKILKYYWASEKKEKVLLYIFNGLNKLRKQGFKIIIRYHPLDKEYFFRYINSYCDNFIVENPENKNIYNSLLETNYVLATYSTVLLEANMMRRRSVIIDHGDNILKLERLDYILVKKKQYIPFSKLLEDYGCN